MVKLKEIKEAVEVAVKDLRNTMREEIEEGE